MKQKIWNCANPKTSLKRKPTDIKAFIIILITNDIKKYVVAEIIKHLNWNDNNNKKNTIPLFPFLLAFLFFNLSIQTIFTKLCISKGRQKFQKQTKKSIQHEDNQNESLEQTIVEIYK